MKQFIHLMILFVLIASCGKSPLSTEQPGDDDFSTVRAKDKESVKIFWDAYREAQKMRTEGKWEEAIAEYTKAIDVDSLHEDSWFNMGNMYLELHRYKDAERCWKKVVSYNDNSAKAHMQLGRLYMSSDRPEIFDATLAEKEFLKSASINVVITGPQMQLGHLNLISGQFDKAKTYYSGVVGSDTRNIEAHFLLAYLEWKSGNAEKAKTYFEKAVANSTPEKAIKDIPSEGDTHDGITYIRPINLSFFLSYFNDLYLLDKTNLQLPMMERFQKLDIQLASIRKQIKYRGVASSVEEH